VSPVERSSSNRASRASRRDPSSFAPLACFCSTPDSGFSIFFATLPLRVFALENSARFLRAVRVLLFKLRHSSFAVIRVHPPAVEGLRGEKSNRAYRRGPGFLRSSGLVFDLSADRCSKTAFCRARSSSRFAILRTANVWSLLFAREFYAASRFPFHRLPSYSSPAALVLSVFIGVHRWLKILLLSPVFSVPPCLEVKNLPLLPFGCGYAALRSSPASVQAFRIACDSPNTRT